MIKTFIVKLNKIMVKRVIFHILFIFINFNQKQLQHVQDPFKSGCFLILDFFTDPSLFSVNITCYLPPIKTCIPLQVSCHVLCMKSGPRFITKISYFLHNASYLSKIQHFNLTKNGQPKTLNSGNLSIRFFKTIRVIIRLNSRYCFPIVDFRQKNFPLM